MSDNIDEPPVVVRRKIPDGPPKCRLCKTIIPSDSRYKNQGYCDCVAKFSRYNTTQNPKSKPAPEPSESTSTPKSKTTPTAPPPKSDSDSSIIKCFKCHYFGHNAKECTTKICDFCKGRRHTSDQCKKNPDNYCTKCEYFGHTSENCVSKICEVCNKKGHSEQDCWKNKVCSKCNNTGHPAEKCKTKCTRCNRFGHPVSECEKVLKCFICKTENFHETRNCPEQKNIECSDCGEKGHHVRFCKNEYMFKNRPY